MTDKLRRALLDLHGAIVATERQAFERKWGRVQASLVQDSPEVAYAHGVAMQALRPP